MRYYNRDLAKPWWDDAPDRATASVRRHRGAREKGIDVALALDAVGAALSDECDVAIVVSRDRDLMEIAHEVRERCTGRPLRVEVAYVSERRGDERALDGYDAHHEIDEVMVERCRDEFDYRQALDGAAITAFLAAL